MLDECAHGELAGSTEESVLAHLAECEACSREMARLEQGQIVIIAPEGTRNKTGRLLRAKAGVVPLALKSGAPLRPLVYYGHEGFNDNVRRLKRSEIHIVVGEPFRLDAHGVQVTKEVRQAMADEIMLKLAALLPPANRGVYADLRPSSRYIVPPGAG